MHDTIISRPLLNRERDWLVFSEDVRRHVVDYTVPQYGDKPDDMLHGETAEYNIKQAQKYLARYGKNQRLGQEFLDLLKAAHCIEIAYTKMREAQNGKETAE